MAPYATLQNVRDEGITSQQISDSRVNSLLASSSERIDSITQLWFEPRTETLVFDGNKTPTLHLFVPIISITSVAIDGAVVDPTDYVAYKIPQHYHNPKIVRRSGRWPCGVQNITIVGSFGWVQRDGVSVPADIREACIRLVQLDGGLLGDATAQAERDRARLIKETTDGHSYEKLGTVAGSAGSWKFDGPTSDPVVNEILYRYRRPIAGGIAR